MNERTQGAAVLTVAAAGVGLAVFVYSRDAFVLLVWAIGAVAVWWVARTPNRTPPPDPEGATETNTQFSVVDDLNHPGRSEVVWNDKETGTT